MQQIFKKLPIMTKKKYLLHLLAVAAVLSSVLSCGHDQQNEKKQMEADSLIGAAYDVRDYERVLTLCDSLEQQGSISLFKAASMRGWAYYYLGQPKLTVKGLRRVLAATPTNANDSLEYFDAAVQLVNYLVASGEDSEALKVAIPALEGLQKIDRDNPSENVSLLLMDLTSKVGQIQLYLGMKEEAARMFEQSYNIAQSFPLKTPVAYKKRFWNINRYIDSYIDAGDMASFEKWLIRQDSVTAMIREGCGLAFPDSDRVMSESYTNHAYLAAFLNRQEEFDRAIAAYRTTQEAKSSRGKENLASVLSVGEHYAEAADEYAVLDQFFAEHGLRPSLVNILYYGDKFRANYKAGRRDTALAVAAYVFEHLDSAITEQKNSDAAELATVYETQQKDAEIAQQQISLTRQRWLGTLVALILLTTFFIVYTLYRRRAQKRLAAAHEKLEVAHAELKSAYDQLEETTAAKERIESELRIARNIQMSMVPGYFPDREGLDLYAEMSPAKEVGGDLYGYVMAGDQLYFCVGDVSGKGVPASLFMAQAARLFHTLAKEGMTPTEIAFRMNNELVENNDSNMFVTMFIGQADLRTGQLSYCNCGHNQPVVDGEFLEMEFANMPLGLWEDFNFQGETVEDIRGRQLLVYTDGLNEAENPARERLGDDDVLQLMKHKASLSSRQVVDMLNEAVEKFRDGAEPSDDLTLMCIRFLDEPKH